MKIASYNFNAKSFKKFLSTAGAEILKSNNEWEIVRFKARDETGIAYKNKQGHVTLTGIATEAYNCFEQKIPWSGAIKNKDPVQFKSVKVNSLLNRDGKKCFYCKEELGEDITIEHLLSRNCGGSNHINNLALAHRKCNNLANHLPLYKKIQLRESYHEIQRPIITSTITLENYFK